LPAGVVVNRVSTVSDFAPDFELLSDCGFVDWDEDIEGECCASEFALVGAMAAELDDRLLGPGDDVRAAKTG